MAEVLYQGHNHNYKVAIKAARSWGVPPRQMILGRPCEWDDVDARLAQALTVLEEETCNSCGTPAWWGHSTNNEIQFTVETAYCHSCAELEKHRKEAERKKQSQPGAIPYVRAHNVWEDKPLPSRSDEYERRSK